MKRKKRQIKRSFVHKKIATEKYTFPKKYIFSGIFVICGAFLFCIVLYCLVQVHLLQTTVPQKLGNEPFFSWDGKNDVIMLVGGINDANKLADPVLVSFDGSTIRYIVDIPPGILIVQDGSYLSLQSLLAINLLNSKDTGIHESFLALQRNTNIHIDGYFLLRNHSYAGSKETRNVYNQMLGDLFGITSPESLSTDKMKINPFVMLLHASKIHTLLSKDGVYTNMTPHSLLLLAQTLSSGLTQQRITLPQKAYTSCNNGGICFDQNYMSQTILQNSFVQNEHARISIYNGTGIDGKADLLSGYVQSVGGIVDTMQDAQQTQKSVIYVQNPANYPETIAWLKRFLHATISTKSFNVASDISVLIGSDDVDNI